MSFNGLTTVNIELTSRCNKNCWMCGRRKIDKEYPEIAMNYGDMDFSLVKSISEQLPDSIVVQLHNNGEPLLYPRLGDAFSCFNRQIRCVDTNGKLLLEKFDEIVGNLETITISTFEGDNEAKEQYNILCKFLSLKGDRKPNIIIRCLGDIDTSRYNELGIVVKRTLHSPMGSFHYKKEPTIPEIGICLDALNHLVISKDGDVSMCVRFDPLKLGIVGNCVSNTLDSIWNSSKRLEWLNFHIKGQRDKIPLCSYCTFWGVPTG